MPHSSTARGPPVDGSLNVNGETHKIFISLISNRRLAFLSITNSIIRIITITYCCYLRLYHYQKSQKFSYHIQLAQNIEIVDISKCHLYIVIILKYGSVVGQTLYQVLLFSIEHVSYYITNLVFQCFHNYILTKQMVSFAVVCLYFIYLKVLRGLQVYKAIAKQTTTKEPL